MSERKRPRERYTAVPEHRLSSEAQRNSCANSREVSRRSKTSSIYWRYATTDTQQMASICPLRRKGKNARQGDIYDQEYAK